MSSNVLPVSPESTEGNSSAESRQAPSDNGRGSPSLRSKPGEQSRGKFLFVVIGCGLVAIVGAVYFLLPRGADPNSKMLTHTVGRGDLVVTVTEQGTLESSDNTEIKNRVRGSNTITWVVEGGTRVKKGDELLRLDTLALDEAISERVKFAHLTRSSAERLKGNVRAAELAINEYLEGRFRTELMTLEKELAVAKSNLQKTRTWKPLPAFRRKKVLQTG